MPRSTADPVPGRSGDTPAARVGRLARLRWRWIAGGLLLLLAIPIVSAAIVRMAGDLVTADAVEDLIRSWQGAGAAVSVLLMIGHSFVPFPAEFVAIANGMLFGVVAGTAITWIGAMMGAVLSFALARRLGQPFIGTMLPPTVCGRLNDWTRSGSAWALLIARLVPAISFNLVNFAAGAVGVGWWTFLWTTALGILPMTSIMVLIGAGMLTSHLWASAVAGLALLVGAGFWAVRRRRS